MRPADEETGFPAKGYSRIYKENYRLFTFLTSAGGRGRRPTRAGDPIGLGLRRHRPRFSGRMKSEGRIRFSTVAGGASVLTPRLHPVVHHWVPPPSSG